MIFKILLACSLIIHVPLHAEDITVRLADGLQMKVPKEWKLKVGSLSPTEAEIDARNFSRIDDQGQNLIVGWESPAGQELAHVKIAQILKAPTFDMIEEMKKGESDKDFSRRHEFLEEVTAMKNFKVTDIERRTWRTFNGVDAFLSRHTVDENSLVRSYTLVELIHRNRKYPIYFTCAAANREKWTTTFDRIMASLKFVNPENSIRTSTPDIFSKGATVYKLPTPAGMHRLDGRGSDVDVRFSIYDASQRQMNVACFGTQEDDARVSSQHSPLMHRGIYVSIDNWNLEETYTAEKIRSKLANSREEVNNLSVPQAESLLADFARWTNDAAEIYKNAIATNPRLTAVSLGSYEGAGGQGCVFASIIPELLKLNGHDQKAFVVNCSGSAFLKGKEVDILVKSVYSSPKDLDWCRSTCLDYQRQMEEANP